MNARDALFSTQLECMPPHEPAALPAQENVQRSAWSGLRLRMGLPLASVLTMFHPCSACKLDILTFASIAEMPIDV